MDETLAHNGTRRIRTALLLGGLALAAAPHDVRAIPVAGTVHYTGTQGSVSPTQPIQIHIAADHFKEGKLDGATITVDRGAYLLDVPAASDYFLVYFLDVINDGALNVGEPYQFYFNEFSAANADPVSVPSSGVSGLKVGFDDHYIMSGVAGTVTYTGTLGSVSEQTPLIVVAHTDSVMLGTPFGRARVVRNGGRYDILDPSESQTFYLIAFLDLNGDGSRDAAEPYAIYPDKGKAPADPVMIGPTQTGIDFVFGDEHLAHPTPTPTPPASCIGDCDTDMQVSVDELLILLRIALGQAATSACAPAAGAGGVGVDAILTAVEQALNACPPNIRAIGPRRRAVADTKVC